MPRRRHFSLPLTLLLVQGCASVVGGGERNDAAVTADQLVVLDLGAAASDGDAPDDANGPNTDSGDCVDRDGDRYGVGLGCINVDCDDTNAAVTDECYCDRPPNARQGCLCHLGDPPLGCDVDTGLSRGAENACNLGQRTCEAVARSPETGRWSECRRWRPDFPSPTRFVGVVSPCAGSCSTDCRHQVICPEAGDPIPSGSTNVVVANSAHAVFCPGGAGLRGGITTACNSVAGATVCPTGTYRRVYEGTTCDASDDPYWGQFNFSSMVPQGTRIEFRVRVAETQVGLASAPWARLSNAPNGTPGSPTSLDVGAQIRASMPTVVGADHFRFLEIEATLVPSPDGTLAPTLISTEVQFTCVLDRHGCRMGSECSIASDPCRRGRIECVSVASGRLIETCVDHGPQPVGAICAATSVCTAAGACVRCAATVEVCDNVDNDCDGVADDGVAEACYGGRAGTAGVGICRVGRRVCTAGAWGACAGQVLPETEVCDALDNDCDGAINDGVTCP